MDKYEIRFSSNTEFKKIKINYEKFNNFNSFVKWINQVLMIILNFLNKSKYLFSVNKLILNLTITLQCLIINLKIIKYSFVYHRLGCLFYKSIFYIYQKNFFSSRKIDYRTEIK